MNTSWGWLKSGLVLGAVFLLAVALVKPIGVSTQYVIADCFIFCKLNPDLAKETIDADGNKTYSSSNAYLNKSNGKYAKNSLNISNYGFIFVIAMFLGGFIASKLGGPKVEKEESWIPHVWRENLGSSWPKRMAGAFASGFFILLGARLAGGCTSGHMMSGMMQTSLSGYIFAAGVFAIAVPVAIIVFKK
jgi:hypothetical protein